MVSIDPILQGALKVPMTFLKVLSYALIVKGEGMIVSMSRPTVWVVLKGQTFKTDPVGKSGFASHTKHTVEATNTDILHL